MESVSRERGLSTHIRLHGFAIVLVAAALGLSLLLNSSASTTGYIFFYIAVVSSSWFGGRWPGALSVVLSTLAVAYYFIAPIHSFAVRREEFPVFIEFAVSAAVVGWFSAWRKEAEAALMRARNELQMRVEERTAELRNTNRQLLEEIAERKRAEEAYYEAQAELARVSRMSALGTLAASIAHEVNQPLAAVVTNADACAIWLSGETPNLEEARTAVDCIAREGTRASEVIRRIRALFTKSTSERTSVQINEVIAEVMTLVQGEVSRNQVELRTELDERLPAVQVDRVQIRQVIFNLVLNGIEAMHGITDRPRRLVIRSEPSERREAPSEQGAGLQVSVRDSGVGIDPKDQKRIFDSFFTTKAKGMGMGLSISRSIIEAHGGRLWAESNGGLESKDGPGSEDRQGVTMRFTLPARPAS